MVQHVTNISSGEDYSKRLSCDPNNELGTLAQGFNQMIAVVQAREDELTKHNENLQLIVEERTQQLYIKAHFDALTNLPNRYLLLERLNSAIASAHRQHKKLAVLFLDLDRFKIINDSLGHDVGDELLQSVAQRLQHIGRADDTVARQGGDEFVYLLTNLDSVEDSGRIAEKIIELHAYAVCSADLIGA
jgi:diguanylate cyclase (GGDEF)-like protein